MNSERKKEKELLTFSLITALVAALLHNWALSGYFYWIFPHFDLLVHFLGGLWLGLNLSWLYFFSGLFGRPPITKKKTAILLSLALFLFGFSWEIFELLIWQTLLEPGFALDTTGDILSDIAGLFFAYRYFVFNFIENKNE
ncbi:hypothetical protein COV42_01300 [Candidatus Campbellbacteria bacterium CG11_big_fil_rev_8_21_14_0_20_44_21]|uniref:VanZ-like domain-containing protein n=1 Tax=Candidatus Campbellbacteria bacterium CG22_combo_CG10-13_8_21_14_all_43_18 TaxID=1974530 RepID=A0A2H0DXE3_9BACT|nr:MAG: hypothetical protein COW82_01615 [Candidatus Campbellbacteria bacterium CG22_combo_CG10-13_8_21_14_all_43_18]PIR24353.1 MAG: hypothetical protein COV42_01300 [Candidatus Campbellbacteria bacterium CG11_big_fil_rev_8_21_14_0_20_44_21]